MTGSATGQNLLPASIQGFPIRRWYRWLPGPSPKFPQWRQGIVSNEPPKVGKPFPALVPQADSDGNDLGGVRLPELQVPVATYTGWNLRDPSIGASDRRISFLGSFIPFAKTTRERQKTGDPRPSLAE